MAGYVTQIRRTPGFEPETVYAVSGRAHDLKLYDFFARTQTTAMLVAPYQNTTSYRSSGREFHIIDLAGSTSGETLKRVRHMEANKVTDSDTGHPFETTRESVILHTDITASNRWGYEYSGNAFAKHVRSEAHSDPDSYLWSKESLKTLGQEAIRDTMPTNSPADLAQALIELRREGLPKLIGSTLSVPGMISRHDVGHEFLNWQFGIKPLLRDVQDTIRAVLKSSEILAAYQDGSGKKQHRTRTFEPRSSYTTEVTSGSLAESGSSYAKLTGNNERSLYMNYGRGALTIQRSTLEKEYFKGCFSYYLQARDRNGPLNRLHEKAEEIEYLLGLNLDVELLWEVLPWSWFADWLGNIGTNIANATALSGDGTVLRYGYMMREFSLSSTYRLTELQPNSFWTGVPGSCSFSYLKTGKERIRATPYGFGLNPDTFNVRQWAILGALGLTRGNNSLRYSD